MGSSVKPLTLENTTIVFVHESADIGGSIVFHHPVVSSSAPKCVKSDVCARTSSKNLTIWTEIMWPANLK